MSISGKPQKVTLINRIGSYYTHHSKVQAAANIFSFHDFFCREVLPSHSTLGTCSRRRPCCYNNKVPSNDRDFNTSHPISFCRILCNFVADPPFAPWGYPNHHTLLGGPLGVVGRMYSRGRALVVFNPFISHPVFPENCAPRRSQFWLFSRERGPLPKGIHKRFGYKLEGSRVCALTSCGAKG